jgi:putative phosphoesterase
MKALVISDTHGKIDDVVSFIERQPNAFNCIWHLGDHYKDGLKISNLTGLDVYAIKGNCDSYAFASEDVYLDVDGYRILLTHGHLYGVKYSMLRLHLKAMEERCDMVCFGHTHVAAQATEGGVKLFNPGSAALPRAGGYPSVGIVEVTRDGIRTSIVPLL